MERPFHFSSSVPHRSSSDRAAGDSGTGLLHAVFLSLQAAKAAFLQNSSWRDHRRAGETAGDIAWIFPITPASWQSVRR